MITDALLLLSSAQVVTATAVSTNTIDLSSQTTLAQVRDMGPGEALHYCWTVDAAVTAVGSATVDFQIISSASANLGSPTVLATTGPIGKAELTLGRRPIFLEIPPSVLAAQPIGQRYLGANYVVATGPLTAGAFTCNVLQQPQDVGKNYPSGFTIV